MSYNCNAPMTGSTAFMAENAALKTRVAELERDLVHITRQRDEVAAKLKQAQQRIQSLTFGSNR